MNRRNLKAKRDRIIQTLRDTGMSDEQIAAELGIESLSLEQVKNHSEKSDVQQDSGNVETPAKSDVEAAQQDSSHVEDDGIIDVEIVETPNLPAIIDGASERMERDFHAYPPKPNRTPDGRSTNEQTVAQHDSMLEKNSERRCTAMNAKGNRCRKIAIYGSNVCRNHGGSARQVVSKARVRVEMASNRLMGKLIEIAFDDSKPAAVQLDAIKDGLNRAGLKPREQVEVGPITPAEEIFADIFTGTREESRRIRGYESPNPEIDQTNLVDHVLDGPSQTAPVDDHAYGGDYTEHVDYGRPAATYRRYDDDRRSMRRSEFHVIGEDALRIANDTRALPPGRSQRRR